MRTVRRFPAGRKAAIDEHLNWVFIMIAGIVILTFFFVAVQRQKAFSERKLGETLRVGFDSIFTGALSAPDTFFNLSIPDAGVGLACDDVCDCKFTTGSTSNSLGDKLVFGPPLIKGPGASLFAKSVMMPFHVATYLYALGPSTRIYLITDQVGYEIVDRLKETLPASVNVVEKNIATLSILEQNNDAHTMFVFVTETEPSGGKYILSGTFKGKSAMGVRIDPTTETAIFYPKKTNTNVLEKDRTLNGEFTIPSDAALVGLLFSGSKEMYQCNLQATYRRLASVAQLYKDRAKQLDDATQNTCDYSLALIKPNGEPGIFDDIIDWAEDRANGGNQVSDPDFSALEKLNNKMVEESCPLVY